MKQQTELDLARRAALQAADHLDTEFSVDADVRSEHGKDIKTGADVESERVILETLAESGHPILAEESGGNETIPSGHHWLVDPLDGTLNFVRGFPMAAVSIGLWDQVDPVLGVVVDIGRKDAYAGMVGEGAWCNDEPLKVSTTETMSRAVLATGFPVGRSYSDQDLLSFTGKVQQFKKIRMIGSAAMSLVYVAAGVFDAYVEEDIMIWDVAAGLALVKAAGGDYVMTPGTKPHAWNVAATNGIISPSSLLT